MKKNKTKKTKTFWLVALVVALVAAIGLVHHSDDLKELANKDEDPITEEVEPSTPEVEVLTFEIKHDGLNYEINYEDGMTWLEWSNSSYYNDLIAVEYNEDDCDYIGLTSDESYYLVVNGDNVSAKDVIDLNLVYKLISE